jgi:hypothetical protein
MRDSRKIYRILVRKPIGQVHLEDKAEDGRIILILSQQNTNSYIFWALLAHQQGAHNCIKQMLNIFVSCM